MVLERWVRREEPAAGLARTAQRAVPTIGKVWGEGQFAGLAVRARDGR